jgi:hypothetical protein
MIEASYSMPEAGCQRICSKKRRRPLRFPFFDSTIENLPASPTVLENDQHLKKVAFGVSSKLDEARNNRADAAAKKSQFGL